MTAPSGRPIAASPADLVPTGAPRAPLPGTDGKSGAVLERVEVDGRPMVLKRLDVRRDWTMRAVGDVALVSVRNRRAAYSSPSASARRAASTNCS